MRKHGVSVKEIAKQLQISKGSASSWVRDIILSVEQLEYLRNSRLLGAERGRFKSALQQKQRRLDALKEMQNFGIKTIGSLTDRELLIAGLALYWGEGAKKDRRIDFCNSDPKMIQFLILWLNKCFQILPSEIICIVGINEIHRYREDEVKRYWTSISGIPLNQFRKTSFKKVTNKKIYENMNDHYGTLAVRVVQPSRFYGKILGLIEGLSKSVEDKKAQP